MPTSVVIFSIGSVAARQVILPNVAVLHANTLSRKIQATKTVRSLLW